MSSQLSFSLTVFVAGPVRQDRLARLFSLCLLSMAVLAQGSIGLRAQDARISEFMAANTSGAHDEDGDFSDWIEIYNPDRAPVSLRDWSLTDDPADLTKWRFPDVTIAGQGFLVVFASGKDRTEPASELHTNFKLSRDGDYLALVQPDGVTKASEFAPAYPRQVSDVSYGVSMATQSEQLLASSASGRMMVPSDDRWGTNWVQPGFNDTTWSPITMSIGYDRPEPGQTNSTDVPPEDVTRQGDDIVATSSNSPGSEGVENAIDNNTATKYLNFDKLDAGLTVTPSAGETVVTGLGITSANDAPERDPTSYILSGSRDGSVFTEIARGSIPDFTARFFSVEVSFTNAASYLHYRLIFPTVRSASAANSVQMSEIELLGYVGAPPPAFQDLITTDVESRMYGLRSSVYVRLPFSVASLHPLEWLALRARYDDGFVAYLNGVEVARANAPEVLAWDATATSDRAREEALKEERFDLSGLAGLIVPGLNVLTLQGLNDRADSQDFLMGVRLENTQVTIGQTGYFTVPSPGRQNGTADLGLVADPVADHERGFYSAPIQVTLTCETPGSTIRYTTDGSEPTAASGQVYSGPISVGRTTALRAAAFRSGWRDSRLVTYTYLFPGDIARQDQADALAAGFPTLWDTQAADYGLDPRVVGQNGQDNYGGKYTASLTNDLQALPTLSLVMDVDDLFGAEGIYSHPNSRGDAWERPGSLELIYPDGRPGFQVNAGIRIQGGAFRRFDLTLKKSFRVIFREDYGQGKLHYPLFGPEATDEFDNIVLRANSNDAWPYDGGGALYIRDAFAMETARAMGIVSSHTTFMHLYINGRYWGLYNPVERPDAAFSATYHGGDKGTWDAINQDSVPDGNYDAWNRLLATLTEDWSDNAVYQRVQGNNPDGTPNPAYEDLLDVDNMIDYMILNFYIGNTDWPGRNYWIGRDREGDEGFQFYPWDSETALNSLGTDVTGVNSAVARPYAAARVNADFQMTFADHVYRHFFNGGALAVNPAAPAWDPAHPENNRPAARFAALADAVRQGIVGESARWGDQLRSSPYTRDENWQATATSLLSNYFPGRSAAVLGQLRNAGLYPNIDAPVFNREGGSVPVGFQLVMSPAQGTIYYTTNGTDPRSPVDVEELNRSTPVNGATVKRVLVPSVANGGSTLTTAWRDDYSLQRCRLDAGPGRRRLRCQPRLPEPDRHQRRQFHARSERLGLHPDPV